MEFEKENDIMDQRQEMMDDAIDDVTGLEDEEESEEVVNQVLDEIGIDLGSAVCLWRCGYSWVHQDSNWLQLGETPSGLQKTGVQEGRIAQAVGGGDPGIYPGTERGASKGWPFMPDLTELANATLDTTTMKVGDQGAVVVST